METKWVKYIVFQFMVSFIIFPPTYIHRKYEGSIQISFHLCRLQILYIGGNKLVDVPDSVGKLKQLQALNLSDNMLESLPAAIANLKNLKSLSLHKNRLRTLPTEIITLKCLTEVCIVFVHW
jgi:Leucine-rich repeat (LRR) protein